MMITNEMKIGWKACRRQVYLLAEYEQDTGPYSADMSDFARGYKYMAKSFAKAFNAFEAEDCDFLREAALSSAHPAPAQEVEVKPLIWSWNDFLDAWEADTAIGRYQAWQINNVGVVKFPHAADGRIVDGAIDAAKAAAQQDYESRIRSAIVSPASAPADANGLPTDAEFDKLAQQVGMRFVPNDKLRHNLTNVTQSLASRPPELRGPFESSATKQEPAAWRGKMSADDQWCLSKRELSHDHFPIQEPLYTQPATDKLALAREALRPLAAVADFMDLETEGFDMTDKLSLVYKNEEGEETTHIQDFELRVFYAARAALSTIEESEHA